MSQIKIMTDKLKQLAIRGNKTAQKLWTIEEFDEFVAEARFEAKLLELLDYLYCLFRFRLQGSCLKQEAVEFALIHYDALLLVIPEWKASQYLRKRTTSEEFNQEWLANLCLTHASLETVNKFETEISTLIKLN